MNILNFGGGGFVGTAYMMGSLLAFDQALVLPELGVSEKKSFFDYAESAGVPFSQLEFRVDEVLAEMPGCVLSGAEDSVSKAFSIAQGISGGSLLAWSMLSGVPLVQLVKTVLEFKASVYFKPNVEEFKERLKSLPAVVSSVVGKNVEAIYRLLANPAPRNRLDYLSRSFSQWFFDVCNTALDALPSGLCTGKGLEEYVDSLVQKSGGKLPAFFSDLPGGKDLIVIASRLDYVQMMAMRENGETEVYFGIPPYDKVSIATAIRASCSLPMILAPMDFYDPVLKRNVKLLDGGIVKTVGFEKIAGFVLDKYDEDVGLWAVFNPIVPQARELANPKQVLEQVGRIGVYERKRALMERLDDKTKARIVLFEADAGFDKGILDWPYMKHALWHGYWHSLEQLSENYEDVALKLSRVGLALVPPNVLRRNIERNNARKASYA